MYSTQLLTSGSYKVMTRRVDIVAGSSSTLDDVKGVAAVGELRCMEQ